MRTKNDCLKVGRTKQIDERIQKAYNATCKGIEINIMDIGKIFAEGKRLITAGAGDDDLRSGIRAFVDNIRQN